MYEYEIVIKNIQKRIEVEYPELTGMPNHVLWRQARIDNFVTFTEYNAARKYLIEKEIW